MKILAFGASTSRSSINKQFAHYTASLIPHAELKLVDLNDFDFPLYSVDKEKEFGFPETLDDFLALFEWADYIIISMAEHNASYTAAFKNIMDWASRKKLNFFDGKKMLLLSTSPGARGGLSVLETALSRFPRHGAEIIASFSLPNFYENFSLEKGILSDELNEQYKSVVKKLI